MTTCAITRAATSYLVVFCIAAAPAAAVTNGHASTRNSILNTVTNPRVPFAAKPQWWQALELRSEAMNRKYGLDRHTHGQRWAPAAGSQSCPYRRDTLDRRRDLM
jgi:hypothetical protein